MGFENVIKRHRFSIQLEERSFYIRPTGPGRESRDGAVPIGYTEPAVGTMGGESMENIAIGLQEAIDELEAQLTETLNVEKAAKRACLSPFYFQRMFGALCGMTVGEYVRSRRLTLAGQELSRNREAKVIDVALKYGYDSPDSFARAFQRFHGVLPSEAREPGVSLQAVPPLHMTLSLEGGTKMEYRIEPKPALTIVGKSRRFHTETSYREIPKFWQEFCSGPDGGVICGMWGVCLDGGGPEFDYWIADSYEDGQSVPEGFSLHTIPAGTWAVFPCRGALPDALQSVNTRIWKEWLPSCREYQLAGNYNVEYYTPMTARPEDHYSEIWIPVVRAGK